MIANECLRTLSQRFLIRIIIGMMVCMSAVAQQSDKVVILNHADSLVGIQINGEQARELIGNVKFTQGKVVVTCYRAIQFLKSNKVSLQGTVEVHDDSVRMVSNRGMYDGVTRAAEAYDTVVLDDNTTRVRAAYGKYFFEERKAYFRTNVSVEDSASTLMAQELIYFRDEGNSIASNNVQIFNKDTSMTMFGNYFENFRKTKYSRMTQNPKVVQIEKSSSGIPDTLVVTSQVMESYQDSLERLIATDNVVLTREGFAAEAGISVFYTALDSIILKKNPIVWYAPTKYDENQVTGDSIFIKLKKRKLQTVYVRGDAYATSRADSIYSKRFNQLTGQEIIMNFAENKVERIEVDRTATSLYYLFEGRKGNGINKTSGDHITFFFENGKIDKIKVIGGVEGQYFPEKIVNHRESEYNLTGFHWQEKRPEHNR